jgi:hypothetical protein
MFCIWSQVTLGYWYGLIIVLYMVPSYTRVLVWRRGLEIARKATVLQSVAKFVRFSIMISIPVKLDGSRYTMAAQQPL